ncbi:Zn-dependent alcohol dehydrogenase [Nonomuraea fuscirosea]|jgi:Zn-dependent alcohol dehydrogenase|uniref:Zn-dependent alcohol dehydrogenase n=1 Tax=Nonomuraea fuscirosea TaxID=1291556 RepID=UPI002DD8FB5C|nr:Zn-dependent alcohol dehydrogenase [Nonomuraea fuscirosea]WSA48623.1 Zn-dependent alcohol dehydrogenase [Nonomuraea fuscirosea]
MRAALLEHVGAPLAVRDLRLDPPHAGEVLVRVEAAGVCHSDQHYLTGDLRCPLPVVPGHEGAGVIEEVGPGVTGLQAGDRVCLMWRPRCGQCPYCLAGRPALCEAAGIQASSGGLLDGTTRLRDGDTRVHHLLGVSCFAEYCVVSERAVVPVPPEVPPEIAAIAGCAVITGVGAVLNAVGECAGDAIVIFGAGGVGLSSVLGARLAGANPIIVVDVVAERLAMAARLGATHTVDASSQDVAAAVRDIRPRGAEWAIEAIGRPATLETAFDVLRPGGTLVAVGLGAVGTTFAVPLNLLVQREKRVVGSLYGSANPLIDLPRLFDLYLAGRLPLGELIGRSYPLDHVNAAFADLAGGSVGRGVLLPWGSP